MKIKLLASTFLLYLTSSPLIGSNVILDYDEYSIDSVAKFTYGDSDDEAPSAESENDLSFSAHAALEDLERKLSSKSSRVSRQRGRIQNGTKKPRVKRSHQTKEDLYKNFG